MIEVRGTVFFVGMGRNTGFSEHISTNTWGAEPSFLPADTQHSHPRPERGGLWIQWPAQAVNRTGAKSKFNFVQGDSFYVYFPDLMTEKFYINKLLWLCSACGVLRYLFSDGNATACPATSKEQLNY